MHDETHPNYVGHGDGQAGFGKSRCGRLRESPLNPVEQAEYFR